MQFFLPKLPYDYNGLEPYIDAKTMEIHHTKHHQTYINNLNNAIAPYSKLQKQTLIQLLSDISALPKDIQIAVKNSGGGHFNHSLYWEIMAPGKTEISSDLLDKLKFHFSDLENFKTEFNQIASAHFGSGWAWLVVNKSNQYLKIYTTPNQDTPLMNGQQDIPILTLDLWEHAYYLKYQNRRAEYIENWWQVVNWKKVSQNYQEAITS